MTAARTLLGLIRFRPVVAVSAPALVAGTSLLPSPGRIVCALVLAGGATVSVPRLPRGRKCAIGIRQGGALIGGLRVAVDRQQRRVTLIGIYVTPQARGLNLAGFLVRALLVELEAEIRRGGAVTVDSYLPVHPASRRLVAKLGARSVTYVSAEAAAGACERIYSGSLPFRPARLGTLFELS